jgi:hypothetical protein
MSTYYLASATGAVFPGEESSRPRYMIPTLTLESMDGLISIPLNGSTGWIRMPGSTGLEMPPTSTTSGNIPGVPGSVLQDIRIESRPVFIPLYLSGEGDQIAFREKLDLLRRLVDPFVTQTFKIVGRSARGTRELTVTYESGLEGADAYDSAGLDWAKIGLVCTANDPFAKDTVDRSLEFRVASASTPFLGVAGGTDAPFPVSLASGAVIGAGMTVLVASEVPVYPTVELVGPMDSFNGSLSPIIVSENGVVTTLDANQWSINIPAGVPAGQTLRLVTDPRIRSFRLDGVLAANRVALGSSLRAFYPGQNIFNVTAPGGNDDTRIRLLWREQHWGLW